MSPIDLPDGNVNYKFKDGGGNWWENDMLPGKWDTETCYTTGFTLLNVESKAGKIATRQWTKELSGTSVTPSDPDRCIKTTTESGSQLNEVNYLGCRIASGKENAYTNKNKCVKEADLCTTDGYKVTFSIRGEYVGIQSSVEARSADIYVADTLISDTSISGSVWGWAGHAIPFEYRNLVYKGSVSASGSVKIYSCSPGYVVWGKDNSSGSWHILRDWKKSEDQQYIRQDCSKDNSKKFCSYIQRNIIVDDSTPANRIVSSHNGYGVVEIPKSPSYIKTDSNGKKSSVSFTCDEIAVIISFAPEVIEEDPDELYYSKIYYRTTDQKTISFAGRPYQPFADASYVKTSYDTSLDIGYWVFSIKAGKKLTKVNNYGFTNLTTLKGICLYPYIEKSVSGSQNFFDNTITEIGEWAFCQCTSLLGTRLIWTGDAGDQYPFIPSGITKIPNKAFMNCTSMTSIDLNNVTQIDGYAFMSSGLTEIDLSKVTQLGTSSFEDCENLIGVKLNSDLNTIPEHCFYSDKKLRKVYTDNEPTISDEECVLNIPCKKLESGCFYDVLQNHKSISIVLLKLEEIHPLAFCVKSNLQETAVQKVFIYTTSLDAWMSVSFYKSGYRNEYYDSRIGSDVFPLEYKFESWKTNVTEDQITTTDRECFGLGGFDPQEIIAHYEWISYQYKLISLSDSSDMINVTCKPGKYEDVPPLCFLKCLNLNKVTIPSTIHQIGSWAFAGAKIVELKLDDTTLYDLRIGAFQNAEIENLQSILTGNLKIYRSVEACALWVDTQIEHKQTIYLPHIIRSYAIHIRCKKNQGYPRHKIYISPPQGALSSEKIFLGPIKSLLFLPHSGDDESNTYNHLQIGKRNNSHSTYVYGGVEMDGGFQAYGKWYNATFGGRLGFRINQDDLLFKDTVDLTYINCTSCSDDEKYWDTQFFPQAYTYYATYWEFGSAAYKDSYTLNKDDYFIN